MSERGFIPHKKIVRFESPSGPGYEVRVQATSEVFVIFGFFNSAEEARKFAQDILYPWERTVPKLKKTLDDINL